MHLETAHKLIQMVCDHFASPVSHIYSNRRFRDYVKVKQWSAWVLRHNTDMSFNEIGILMSKHHTMIIYYARQAQNDIEIDYEGARAFSEELNQKARDIINQAQDIINNKIPSYDELSEGERRLVDFHVSQRVEQKLNEWVHGYQP